MQGVPWHVETIKKNDTRRHKNWCKNYNEGYCKYYCARCHGSKYCEKYEYDRNREQKNKSNIMNHNHEVVNKCTYSGMFKIKYNDEDEEKFIIGKNINENAPIIKEVYKCDVNDTFNFNGEKVTVIMKKIDYK